MGIIVKGLSVFTAEKFQFSIGFFRANSSTNVVNETPCTAAWYGKMHSKVSQYDQVI